MQYNFIKINATKKCPMLQYNNIILYTERVRNTNGKKGKDGAMKHSALSLLLQLFLATPYLTVCAKTSTGPYRSCAAVLAISNPFVSSYVHKPTKNDDIYVELLRN